MIFLFLDLRILLEHSHLRILLEHSQMGMQNPLKM